MIRTVFFFVILLTFLSFRSLSQDNKEKKKKIHFEAIENNEWEEQEKKANEMLKNPGFEEGLYGWNSYWGAQLSDVSHTGKASCMITNDNFNNWKGTDQTFELKNIPENTNRVEVSTWIKTHNVIGGKGDWDRVLISVGFKDEDDGQISNSGGTFAFVQGTTDWTKYREFYSIPLRAKKVVITLAVGNSSGAAWFDDLEFKYASTSEYLNFRSDFKNPGFESELNGWPDWAGEATKEEAHSGAYSLKVHQNVEPMQWIMRRQQVAVPQNTRSIVVGVWVKLKNVTETSHGWEGAKVSLEFIDENGKSKGSGDVYRGVGTTDGWVYYENLVYVPEEAKEFTISAGLANVNGAAYFDDFQLKYKTFNEGTQVDWSKTDLPISYFINPLQDKSPISPYIYGTNHWSVNQGLYNNIPSRRIGGNANTPYNWENNATNSGADWFHMSTPGLLTASDIPKERWKEPGIVLTDFHDNSLKYGAVSFIQIPCAGYVAADFNGTVTEKEKSPSRRWKKVEFRKDKPLSLIPDSTDGYVYVDELLNFLITKYGKASSPNGIKGFFMDNEPTLWTGTHSRLYEYSKPNATDIISRNIRFAQVLKELDPSAASLGYGDYGWYGMLACQGAQDWTDKYSKEYSWFVDCYLDKMKKASDSLNTKLLDYFDFHWYPERYRDQNGKDWDFNSDTSKFVASVLMSRPRSLWDSTYIENSWIGQSFKNPVTIIQRTKKSINQYYPGLKMSITEWGYGNSRTIACGIAHVDVMGIYGKYGVDMATMFGQVDFFAKSAFLLYRNYDKKKGTFGDISVHASPGKKEDIDKTSVYASLDSSDPSKLHIIILNKDFDNNILGEFTIQGEVKYDFVEAWFFHKNNDILEKSETKPVITDNKFTYKIPPLSAYHMVLKNK